MSPNDETVEKLEAKLSKLKEELREEKENVYRAAEIGKRLLDENGELENRMQSLVKDHRTEIEDLEQQKYSLQLKLEQKSHMEKVYVEEIEGLKQSLQSLKESMSMKEEAEYQAEISKLKTQMCQQQSDLDRLNLSEKQIKERNTELEKVVEELREQLQQKVNTLNETCSDEMAQLHSDINTLQGEKLSLLKEVGECKDQMQHLLLQVSSLREQFSIKESELEERQCQITSYHNSLEKSREENLELKAEIDMLRMESQDQKQKGNSLFSEVEDRRVEAEKQLISMKVEYASLRKQYEASRQNHQKLRMQVAGLLQSSSGRADAEHVESLKQQLSQKNNELYTLMSKLQKYEKQEKSTVEQLVEYQGSGATVDKNYLEFLQALADNKQKEFDKLQEELRTKSLQLLAEGEKLMSCEAKLYSKERIVESLRGQNYKLQVQIEELRLKYEPEQFKTSKKIRKGVKEQIPLTKTDSENTAKPGETKPEENLKNSDKEQKQTTQNIKPTTGEIKSEDLQSKKHKLKEELVKTLCDDVGMVQPPKVSLAKYNSLSNSKKAGSGAVNGLKKRKVTISDENEIVEPETYDDLENEENKEVCYELSDNKIVSTSEQRSSTKCQKTVSVPRAAEKLDPNECKSQ